MSKAGIAPGLQIIDVTGEAEPALIEHDDGCDEAKGKMPYHTLHRR
jgi:hypothetical protein